MKHTNKKGFTIVELVIVIAVIAILAAVLIPTFSNLIKKANQSSDIQAARQMNTVLAAEQGIGDNIDKVIDVLVENGYSANGLTPVTADHKFYYVVANECIVLVDTKKNEVVFPADVELTDESVKYDLGEGVKYIDVVAGTKDALNEAASTGSVDVILNDNITIDKRLVFFDELTLNLNEKVLSSSNASEAKAADDSTLSLANNATISGNGTIKNDAGTAVSILDVNENGITVTINDGTYIGNGQTVFVWGGHLVINGGHFESTNEEYTHLLINMLDEGNRTVESSITIKGGTFVNFNPAESPCGEGEIVIPEGYTVVSETKENGDIWYTVVAE